MRTARIGISLGDVTGIGPEVALKALAEARGADETRYLLIGDLQHIHELNRKLGVNLSLEELREEIPAFSGESERGRERQEGATAIKVARLGSAEQEGTSFLALG